MSRISRRDFLNVMGLTVGSAMSINRRSVMAQAQDDIRRVPRQHYVDQIA